MMRRLILALVLACTAAAAQAQFRTIPVEAKRAVMGAIDGNVTTLDGKRVLTAVGLQIRDGRNLIVVPTAVPPNLIVRYLLDSQGQLSRVWILSPAEASAPDPK